MSHVDEYVLEASLDDVWRSPVAIKRKFKIAGKSEDIAAALQRLAAVGRIERKSSKTLGIRMRHKYRFDALSIETYRRLT